jgi:hypothetical protein
MHFNFLTLNSMRRILCRAGYSQIYPHKLLITRSLAAFTKTSAAFFWGTLVALIASSSCEGTNSATRDARRYLEFETVLDGKCYNLSAGGNLITLRNVHPTKRVDYRLVRVFAEKAQGLTTGSLEPRGSPQKLGCDKVDGRAQTWRIDRARFNEE